MNRGSHGALTLATVVVAALVLYRFTVDEAPPDGGSAGVTDVNDDRSIDTDSADVAASPFATRGDDRDPDTVAATGDASGDTVLAGAESRTGTGTLGPVADALGNNDIAPLEGPVDVTALGHADLSDDDFEALIARLGQDPTLLAAVISEARSATDPARRARLVQLLGRVGGPDVTAWAAELAYSNDPVDRSQGLELLRRVQPGNADARAIVAGLLSTETMPRTLLPTLQTLSRPGVVNDEDRGELAAQIALLSMHTDASVRRLGLDMLSRWSVGDTHTTILVDGLQDSDARVRETAAYAFTRRSDIGESAVQALLAVVENEGEEKSVRRGAVRALDDVVLDAEQMARVAAIRKGLNRLPAR